MSWHDLVLYLIARYAGATAAQEVARRFALQWHQDGLTPYIVFEGNRDHGDGDIQSAQQWLETHFSIANPVQEMIKRSRLAGRTFKRRFKHATGIAPLAYVQRLRIEDAKRRLERTEVPIDEISWQAATRIRPFSGACSSARQEWHQAPIASVFESLSSPGH